MIIQKIIDLLTVHNGNGVTSWLGILVAVSILIMAGDVLGGYLTARFSNMLKQLAYYGSLTDFLGGYGLSGEEKQRISLVRMMWQGKEILILDEPTTALDPENRRLFDDWMLGHTDKTIIRVSQYLEMPLISRYDTIIYMNEGKIEAQGSLEEVMENEKFVEFTGHVV